GCKAEPEVGHVGLRCDLRIASEGAGSLGNLRDVRAPLAIAAVEQAEPVPCPRAHDMQEIVRLRLVRHHTRVCVERRLEIKPEFPARTGEVVCQLLPPPCGEVEKASSAARRLFGWGWAAGMSPPHPILLKLRCARLRRIDLPARGR